MTATADLFPAGLALAALGGEGFDWTAGWRRGWEMAEGGVDEDEWNVRMRSLDNPYSVVYPSLFNQTPMNKQKVKAGMIAGRAAYERENR